MALPIHTIHVNSATKTSLNDRFTALSSQPKASIIPLPAVSSRRRSRSRGRDFRSEEERISSATSVANRRLLQQLASKHKMMAALKLKRRSIKPGGSSMAQRRATNGTKLKRGSVKALRLTPSGNPIKANSLSKVATMKADLIGRLPARRSNSVSGRLGALRGGRVGVGGAAGRVAKRRLSRNEAARVQRPAPINTRRSRSRSRARLSAGSKSNSTTNLRNMNFGQNVQRNPSRGRARSRSRSRVATPSNKKLPIAARLGVKPGSVTTQKNASRGKGRGNLNRINQGRIQKPKRQNSSNRKALGNRGGGGNGNLKRRLLQSGAENQISGNKNRLRGRSSTRGQSVRRSRSRSRNNQRAMSAQRKPQQQQASPRGGVSRSRSFRGRRGAAATGTQRNNNGQPQVRRGRSRSRGRGRQLGNSSKKDVKKEDLDKELDQYMATTKTETGMDFLLRN